STRRFVIGGVDGDLKLLMGVVALGLLIVCANVAASSLARGATRAREMAIRAALGARRARLIGPVLIEHLWLGEVGGIAGLFGGWLIARLVLARWGSELPRAGEITMDWRVAVFALATSLVAGLASGCLPAMLTRRTAPRDALAGGSAATGGRGIPGA